MKPGEIIPAAGDDQWTKLPSAKALALVFKREDLLKRFASGRAVALGLSLEPDPWLRVAVNAEDVQPVGDWFGQQLAGDQTKVELVEGWATVVVPCPLKDVSTHLGKLIPPSQK